MSLPDRFFWNPMNVLFMLSAGDHGMIKEFFPACLLRAASEGYYSTETQDAAIHLDNIKIILSNRHSSEPPGKICFWFNYLFNFRKCKMKISIRGKIFEDRDLGKIQKLCRIQRDKNWKKRRCERLDIFFTNHLFFTSHVFIFVSTVNNIECVNENKSINVRFRRLYFFTSVFSFLIDGRFFFRTSITFLFKLTICGISLINKPYSKLISVWKQICNKHAFQ